VRRRILNVWTGGRWLGDVVQGKEGGFLKIGKSEKHIKEYKGECQGRTSDRSKVHYGAIQKLNTKYQGEECPCAIELEIDLN
jgi:hypothetical protein